MRLKRKGFVMPPSIFDRLPMVNLDHFDEFRGKYYNHLYLCHECRRSFDTIKKLDACKFCGSPRITEMKEIIRKGAQISYKYFCPTCERNFISENKLNICPNCRTEYLHVYTWDTLRRRDKIYIKLAKAFYKVFGRHKENGKEATPEKRTTGASLPRIRLSKDGEELPTY